MKMIGRKNVGRPLFAAQEKRTQNFQQMLLKLKDGAFNGLMNKK
jgi:hypothetical protein